MTNAKRSQTVNIKECSRARNDLPGFPFLAGLALIVFLSGCGLTAHERVAVRQFGSATADFASLTRAEFLQSREDVIQMNRFRVLLGATNVAALDDPFTLQTSQTRLRALDALNQQAELLLRLLTTSSAAELQVSADAFVASVNGIPGLHMEAGQTEALGKAVATVGGLWVEHKRARAMRRIVELSRPPLTNIIALVERDFDPDDDVWSAGYRRARLDLEDAIRIVPGSATRTLADAQTVRLARLAVLENRLRFDLISATIRDAAARLRDAEAELHRIMTAQDITSEDIPEFRSKVNDVKTLFELLRPASGQKGHP